MFCTPIILGLSNCNTETIQLTRDRTYSCVGEHCSRTSVSTYETFWCHNWQNRNLKFYCLENAGFHSSKEHLLWKDQRESVCPLHYTQLGVFVNWIDISFILDLHSSLCLFILNLMINFSNTTSFFFFYESEIARSHCYVFKKCMLYWHFLLYSIKMNKQTCVDVSV